VSLLDKAAKKLALRWLKRKVDGARKEGSGVMRAADGWKSLIVVIGFIGATVVSLYTGQPIGDLLGGVLNALGWSDPDTVAKAKGLATVVAPLLLAIWAASSKLLKAVRQYGAGARGSELLSDEGHVKLVADERGLQGLLDVATKFERKR
jgi:hypothetical protein